MKKMIKMSLVAAVAVAGLNTTASAANLEEAIKGTTVSGYVRYRLETDHENETDVNEKAKAVVKVSTPVNDMVTANVKVVAGESETQNVDTKADLNVNEANFVIKAAGATVIAGLQTSQSPFFANNGDTRSHGITALVPAGPVTLAGAYYMTTTAGGLAKLSSANATGDAKGAMTNDVGAIGVLGDFGAVSVKAWYAAVEDGSELANGGSNAAALNAHADLIEDASAYSLDLSVKAGPANIQLMTTQVSTKNTKDTGLTKLVVTGKADTISYMAAYAQTNEDGGRTTLDGDSDAISDLGLHVLNMQKTIDATAFAVSGKIQATEQICASLTYLDGSSDAHADFNELDLKVGYKMSKNFGASVIYGMGEDTDAADFAESRIEVKYTF